jgi:hypothetical protein
MRSLNTELTCAICLGIIRNCHAILGCAHRFCQVCIEKSLRFGKKQCPQCRGNCPSARSLRKDESFDAVIAQIYPNREQAEEEEEKEIMKITESAAIKNLALNAMQSVKQQQEGSRSDTHSYTDADTHTHTRTHRVTDTNEPPPPAFKSNLTSMFAFSISLFFCFHDCFFCVCIFVSCSEKASSEC